MMFGMGLQDAPAKPLALVGQPGGAVLDLVDRRWAVDRADALDGGRPVGADRIEPRTVDEPMPGELAGSLEVGMAAADAGRHDGSIELPHLPQVPVGWVGQVGRCLSG